VCVCVCVCMYVYVYKNTFLKWTSYLYYKYNGQLALSAN